MPENNRIKDFLSDTMPFSFLSSKELEEVVKEIVIEKQKKGTILFIQDRTELEFCYIIKNGAVERYFEDKEGKTLCGKLSEGEIFGGISILVNHGVMFRTIRTIEDSVFFALPKKTFLELCEKNREFSDFFLNTFGRRMLDKTYSQFFKSKSKANNYEWQFFNQTVNKIFSQKIVNCYSDDSIREAAVRMTEHDCSSILIKDEEDNYVGILTDNDLRKKVIAKGYDSSKSVSEVMSYPLSTVSAEALVSDAMIIMMEKKRKHLAVTHGPNIIGVVTHQDLVKAQGLSPIQLVREISLADSVEEIAQIQKQVPAMVRQCLNIGVKAKNIMQFITAVSDAVVNRLSGFFRFLTENAISFKPPLGFFRSFVVESKGKHRNSFDIKSAMMRIVDFARIYALKNKIEETNTLDRLYELYLKGILKWHDYNELEKAYSFLTQLRFVRQITAIIEENAPPDNYINPKKLSVIEQTMLKEIFKKIEKCQTRLSFDFKGIG